MILDYLWSYQLKNSAFYDQQGLNQIKPVNRLGREEGTHAARDEFLAAWATNRRSVNRLGRKGGTLARLLLETRLGLHSLFD